MGYGRFTMTEQTARRASARDRRRQLVDAAAALFAERGYPHVSVSDVAARAGVSVPTVYRHFDDKQALLYAAVLESAEALVTRTDSLGLDTATDPAQALAAGTVPFMTPASQLWRWSGQHLSAEQNAEVVRLTRTALRRWAAAIRASRPGLTERESMYLAGAILSVSGSVVGRSGRSGRGPVEGALVLLYGRIVRLTPSVAPPLPAAAVPDMGPRGRRDEILDAAADLFARQGFAGTGVDDIGAAVGITGPSVYKHFPSKTSILLGVAQRSVMRLEAAAMVTYALSAGPAGRLDALVDDYVRAMTDSPDLLVSLTSGHVLAGEPTAGELVVAQRRYVSRWEDLLRQLDPELPEWLASLTVHAALSIVNDAVRLPRSTPLPEFAARMAYLVKGTLGR